MKRITFQIAVCDHELRETYLGVKGLIEWIRNKLIWELDRAAPHGPIEFWAKHNDKTHTTVYEAVAEWKEPIQ